MANTMEIKKGDLVEVTVGGIQVKGKRGKVLATSPKQNKVIVDGLNVVVRHTKPRSAQQPGGKIEKPRPIDVSNVMLVCPNCDKATRNGHVLADNGKYVRQCKKCGAVIADRKEGKPGKGAKTTAKKKTAKKAEKAE